MKEQVKKTILQNMVIEINRVMNLSKTSMLSTGLFLQLKVNIVIEKDKTLDTESKLTFADLANNVYSTIDNNQEVRMVIRYGNKAQLKATKKLIEKHTAYFTFLYFVEVQMVLRQMYTATYHSTMLRYVTKKSDPHTAIYIASKIAVNNSLKAFFQASDMKSYWDGIASVIDTSYDSVEPMVVLKQIASKLDNVKPTRSTDDIDFVELESFQYAVPKKKLFINTESSSVDSTLQTLAVSLMDVISTNAKGSDAGDRFAAQFDSIKIDVNWLKNFKGSFEREVYYKTKESYSSWKGLSNVYRTKMKAPKRIDLEDKLDVIISIDQSGSMHTEDMQKLMGVIEAQAKNISSIRVIMHDTDTVVFDLESANSITDDTNFKKALGTRMCNGGTSHKFVFSSITEYMKTKEPSKVIYLMLTDGYSDIERYAPKHPVLDKIKTFYVRPSEGSRPMDKTIFKHTEVVLP